jgi:hypothetical protein
MAFNAGTITCAHKVTTANIFFAIPIGYNRTQVAAYTIPAGKTGYLRSGGISMDKSGSATASGFFLVQPYGYAPQATQTFTVSSSSDHIRTFYGGLPITEKTDLVERISSCSSTNIALAAWFEIVLVNN